MADPKPWIRPEDVVQAVSTWTGVKVDDLTSSGGRHRIQKARGLLAWCLRLGLNLSLREIANILGYLGPHKHSAAKHLLTVTEKDVDGVEVALLIEQAERLRGLA